MVSIRQRKNIERKKMFLIYCFGLAVTNYFNNVTLEHFLNADRTLQRLKWNDYASKEAHTRDAVVVRYVG